jgi:hypothetical protein
MAVIDPDMPQSESQNITKEKIQSFLPRGSSHIVSDKIIDLINNMENDTGLLQEYMEDSFMTHLPMLKGIKVKLEDYVNAIKYCNLKRHMTNDKAWAIVFPKRYDKLVEEGRFNSSHAAMYNQTEIVSRIDAQMHIAASIQYAPYFHASIKKQYDLMNGIGANPDDRVSPTVQHLAAGKLADLTAPEKDNKITMSVEIGANTSNRLASTYNKLNEVAVNQQKLLEAGHSLEEIQKLNIVTSNDFVDADIDEDDEEEDEL